MRYPLVLDLADDGIPVAVTCRVVNFSKQAFYAWRAQPVSQRIGTTRTCSTPRLTSTPPATPSATG